MGGRLDQLLTALRDPQRRPIAVLGAVAVAVAVAAALLVAVGDDDGDDEVSTRGSGRTTSTDAPAGDTTTTTSAGSTTSVAPAPTSASEPSTTRRPTTSRGPAPAGPSSPLPRLKLTRVAAMSQPLAMAIRPGDTTLYVAEKGGRVRAIRNGNVDPTPVLDISGQVSTGSEQGLLGIAFSPTAPRMYVNYTDRDGDTQIVEYDVSSGRAQGGRTLLSVDQPYANHNGGHIVFGPDGKLYIGLGDGGSGGDPHDNGQNLNALLGKILRIDPAPAGVQQYTVPPDNPFVGRAGTRGEIWSYGLRNPWRFSFDRATGDIWIADVGQRAWEEIDRGPSAGRAANYGWARREGTHPYNGGARPDGNVDPVYEYGHGDGSCSVTGGHVYRGDGIAGLRGAYLFGDYCSGRVQALVPRGGGVRAENVNLDVDQLSSFGEDHSAELYALSLEGAVYRIDAA